MCLVHKHSVNADFLKGNNIVLVLLVVYFDLDFALAQTSFLFTFLFIETLLAYKCFCIFFGYAFGWVHLILYFCTLEIAPLVILWRSLHVLTGYLAAIEL